MITLKNKRFSTKLILGNSLVLSIVAILGIVSYLAIANLLESSKWVDHTHSVIERSMEVEAAAVDMETGMRGFMLAGKDNFLEPYNGGQSRFFKLVKELKVTVNDNPAQVKLLNEIEDNISGWIKEVTEPQIALRREVDAETKTMEDVVATIQAAKGKTFFDKFRGQISTFRGREVTLMKARKAEAEATATSSEMIISFGTVAVILFALVIIVFITRNISASVTKLIATFNSITDDVLAGKLDSNADEESVTVDFRKVVGQVNKLIASYRSPIQEIMDVMQSLAAKNLTAGVKGNYQGQLNALKNNVNLAISTLRETLQEVENSIDNVTTGSSQVASSSQALSQGATEQAASLEEINSSMNEIGSQTKKNAENATQAERISNEAKNNANEGNELMKSMVSAMAQINESSESISKIIKVIDEIAFQTNLLALNAAVEAARAGKHGKGFAVVAEEVRNLAARSAQAAKETTDLIEDSTKRVVAGTKIVEDTNKSLEQIVGGSSKVTDIVIEIASASNNQNQAISQIVSALGQVDSVTQQNTSSAEESASSSQELSSQASRLKELIKQFQISVEQTRESVSALEEELKEPEAAQADTEVTPQTSSSDGWGDEKKEEIILDDKNFGKY